MAVLIIAGTVTVIEQLMAAYTPTVHRSLGIFLPLIVTNCLILGRAEVYARKHSVPDALMDALVMGTGFGLVLIALGAVRELLGHVLLIALLPPGAFITLGFMLALKNAMTSDASAQTNTQPNTQPNTQANTQADLKPDTNPDD